ncbi:MAG: mannonate dehydratase [Granulosicoccus sp.]|jgi:mannonate dehydratase
MKQTWRWFGPADAICIEDIEQTGATGVVSSLYQIPNGAVWSRQDIEVRKREVAQRFDGSPSALRWDVVESLPVSEDIKKQDGDWRSHIANYKLSLENLAAAGLKVVCYNFMPVLDWTRTDLAWLLTDGAACMRFDIIDFAAFDLFILNRPGAMQDFSETVIEAARERHATMSAADCQALLANLVKGLPGANQELSFDEFKGLLTAYDGIGPDELKANLYTFLKEVVPVAESLGVRLCCHPDDPPFPLLGLPRVVSTESDYAELIAAVDSPANGITLCSGSLGVHPGNDLPGMMQRLGHKVGFLHLRNIRREGTNFPGSFHEAAHLDGNTDMVAFVAAILTEEARRKAEGREDWNIPMRPDHGHEMMDDFNRKRQPGYPLIGRLRGLAELRGVITALSSDHVSFSDQIPVPISESPSETDA